MADITLKGNLVHTVGNLPNVGSAAPDFTLVKSDLSEVSLHDFKGKKIILNIFPSLDTGTCAMSVRKFNEKANKLENAQVLCVSHDLPFAHSRFCDAEGIENLITLSCFRNPKFGQDYGVLISDGPLKGLLSRAVIVLDESAQVIYSQQVGEIVDEPDYEKALASLI